MNNPFIPQSTRRKYNHKSKYSIQKTFVRFFINVAYAFVFMLSFAVTAGMVLLLESKSIIFSTAAHETRATDEPAEPFPVSVDMYAQIIEDNPVAEEFFTETLAQNPQSSHHWWNQIAELFSTRSWYQQLAAPVSRIVVIWPGDRKEELAKKIGDNLGWDQADRNEFKQLMDTSDPVMTEGKYFPGQYVTHYDATPEDMHELIYAAFEDEILEHYTDEVSVKVPLETTLIIASLIEREASNDLTNMREISGVIWNRIFIDMPLQLDATLQYVRGSKPQEPSWWPIVHPNDKYLTSPYNTYENEGLPPAPIANPSAEAVLAALNPIITDCLFYFHTNGGGYHCSADYEGHVAKLKAIYGRGS